MNEKQQQAIEWLRKRDGRERMIYEGADRTGKKGCGLFYIDYSNGAAPVLTRPDVDELLRLGIIKNKWRDLPCYVLSS